MAIHQWPLGERPREKLLAQGAQHLSDAELLAILLGSGTKGKSAVEVARDLLLRTGGLRQLFYLTEPELSQLPGLGPASIARMQAALELSKRCLYEKLQRKPAFESAAMVKEYLLATLQHLPYEIFAGLLLDNQHRLLHFEIFSRGTLDQSAVYPREIIKKILQHHAAAVIFVHNHPSGSTLASSADIALTQALDQALKTIQVRLLDHFIVGDGEIASLSEQGLFWS